VARRPEPDAARARRPTRGCRCASRVRFGQSASNCATRPQPLAERPEPHGAVSAPMRGDHVESRRGARERSLRIAAEQSRTVIVGPPASAAAGAASSNDEDGDAEASIGLTKGCQTGFAVFAVRPSPDRIFTTVACVSRRGRRWARARERSSRGLQAQPRVLAIPVRPRSRGEPGDAGLPHRKAGRTQRRTGTTPR